MGVCVVPDLAIQGGVQAPKRTPFVEYPVEQSNSFLALKHTEFRGVWCRTLLSNEPFLQS